MKTVKIRARILTATLCALLASAAAAPGQDAAGNVVKVTTTLHPDGTRTITKLDAVEHTSESSRYSGERLLQRTVFKLNEQNQPESGDFFDGKGTLVHKLKFVRDESGRVSEEIRFTPDDRFVVRYVYRYDATGRVLKMDGYDADGNPLPTGPARRDVKKDRRSR
jgi:hypothetical protein